MNYANKTRLTQSILIAATLVLPGFSGEAQKLPAAGTFTATKPDDCRRFFGTPDRKNTFVLSQLNGCLSCLAQGGVKYELYGGGTKCSTDTTVKTITSVSSCSQYKTEEKRKSCERCFNKRLGLKYEAADATPNPVCSGRAFSTASDCVKYLDPKVWPNWQANCKDCVNSGGHLQAEVGDPEEGGWHGNPFFCYPNDPPAPVANQTVTTPAPNTYYYIIAKHSGKALSVHGGGQEDGAIIDQWENQHSDNQKWRFEQTSDGTYRVIVKHSGKLLTIHGGGRENGAIADQWADGGGPNQRYFVNQAGDGAIYLVPQNTGKLLTVHGGGQENGAIVDQWDVRSTDNQKWRLMVAEPAR